MGFGGYYFGKGNELFHWGIAVVGGQSPGQLAFIRGFSQEEITDGDIGELGELVQLVERDAAGFFPGQYFPRIDFQGCGQVLPVKPGPFSGLFQDFRLQSQVFGHIGLSVLPPGSVDDYERNYGFLFMVVVGVAFRFFVLFRAFGIGDYDVTVSADGA